MARSIAWAREHGVPFAPRTGRHSYAGYSTSDGLIIESQACLVANRRMLKARPEVKAMAKLLLDT